MYAVVRIAGFQYLVKEGDVVTVPRLAAQPGTDIQFGDVLMVRTTDKVVVGRPLIADARIEAQVIDHPRAAKVTTFKFIRRENYRRKKGHRQPLTRIRVAKIVCPG